MTKDPLDVLACPRCDKPLEKNGAALHCSGCALDYPDVGGVPWLFAEPAFALADWRQRLDFLLRRLENDAERLGKALEDRDGLAPLTRDRLELVEAATADHARRLGELLAPLTAKTPRAALATYLALRTRLPPDQGLLTYYSNLHRDWSWGGEENDAALELLGSGLEELPRHATILVLGSGAGRLAYDLHARHAPALTLALDFNPMLQLAASRIAGGEAIELYEFPLAPRRLRDHAVLRRLEAPSKAGPGLRFVLGDALRPPLKASAFDAVVTPWLVDILPEDFAALCARINRLLAPQGRWLNLGSLAFDAADPRQRYSLEECAMLVEASGFAPPHVEERQIPYMCSPASRHGRRETAVAWHALKRSEARPARRFEALPDWLVEGREPVPALDAFKLQAATTRIYAGLMGLIDGRRSVQDIARILVEQRVLAPADAETAVRNFLTKMYDDSRRAHRL